MITVDNLFYGILGGTFQNANPESKLAFVEYILPILRRWNIAWGDGTIDMYANNVSRINFLKEKVLLLTFGTGSKLIMGTCDKQPHVYYTLFAGDAQRFNLPSPDLIVERITGRQYYIYFLDI